MIALQLAGHSLGSSPESFPFFEKVATFNSNEAVEIAIDPAFGSAINGKTCRLYIVEDRTKSQWMSCPRTALSDVTPGGELPPTTFSGSTIFQNVRTVAVSGELSTRAEPCYTVMENGSPVEKCTGLGHPYDVVADCDQDGYLSFGDFVDGFGDPIEGTVDTAGFYVVHDTTQNALPTYCIDVKTDLGTVFGLNLSPYQRERVWVPSNFASIPGTLPLVVISHGQGHLYSKYNYLQQHLASYGYVVMSHENDTGAGVEGAAVSTVAHTDLLLDIVGDPTACAAHLSDRTACGSAPMFDLCALYGKIDASRIIWIGHSRGGGGDVLALNRMQLPAEDTNRLVPEHFGTADIRLISSIAPMETGHPDPGSTPYHLIWDAGDQDVEGGPDFDRSTQAFRLYDRATGPKSSIYMNGGAHGWFHENCAIFEGTDCAAAQPNPVSLNAVHEITKGYFLPLLKHYIEDNEAAREFFWRPWERFHPIGVEDAAAIKVALEYRPKEAAFAIDDFQTNTSPTVSSSGGTVTQNLDPDPFDDDITFEGLLQDEDKTFDWERSELLPVGSVTSSALCNPQPPFTLQCPEGSGPNLPNESNIVCEMDPTVVEHQPMNGMTRGYQDDSTRGFVFEWTGAINGPNLQFQVSPSMQDFTQHRYLSFRLAQMPRHPLTLQRIGDLDLTVALIDTNNRVSRIRLSALSESVVEPYARVGGSTSLKHSCIYPQRTCLYPAGCNEKLSQIGWQAEFETIRVRCRDFLTEGNLLDLRQIAAVRFEMGANSGDEVGRVTIDDLELTAN